MSVYLIGMLPLGHHIVLLSYLPTYAALCTPHVHRQEQQILGVSQRSGPATVGIYIYIYVLVPLASLCDGIFLTELLATSTSVNILSVPGTVRNFREEDTRLPVRVNALDLYPRLDWTFCRSGGDKRGVALVFVFVLLRYRWPC